MSPKADILAVALRNEICTRFWEVHGRRPTEREVQLLWQESILCAERNHNNQKGK